MEASHPGNQPSKLPKVELFAEASIPTAWGDFRIHVFHNNLDKKEHFALTLGDVTDSKGILVRVHSECLTGESLGSLRCDCKLQLDASIRMISQAGRGIIIYLRQEGRGIGLGNKIKAYALQEEGLDTIQANHQLGFAADLRSFNMAVSILKYFNIKSLLLLTNNPDKVDALQGHGIDLIQRVPLEIEPTEYSREYLRTKRDKSGHLLEHVDDWKAILVDLPVDPGSEDPGEYD
jgi:3,4-dihydroxy 2-butanone 4-phosphate synthase/GTP cyclohydrolase II